MPSMRETHPHLAEVFHPTKNGDLTPDNLTAGTDKRIWWICPTCDHEWKTSGSNRQRHGCPYCNGTNKPLHSDGRNSMANTHPELAKDYQGDATKIIAGTSKKLDWKCSTCDHEWKARGNSRRRGHGCAYCSNNYLHSDGRNSMANTHPKLAKEYQGDATKVIAGTGKRLPWKCSTCDHEWKAASSDRTSSSNHGCPCCNRNNLHSDGRNSMAKTHPHLALEYQGDATKIIAGTKKNLDWKCSTCDHEWRTTGDRRRQGRGCPHCAEVGFKPNKAGHVYLMKYEGANEKTIYKIGISHKPKRRRDELLGSLRQWNIDAQINIIDTMYFDVGEDAMEMEKTFHAMEEHRFTPKKKFEGWTEMFKASIVDVWNRMVKI